MGFFSQDCKRKECGHPALSPYAITPGVNDWMMDVVVITPRGDIVTGRYDGYGCVGQAEEAVGFENTVYHRACWELEGKPLDFQGASKQSADQGFFFDDDEHQVTDPRLVAS